MWARREASRALSQEHYQDIISSYLINRSQKASDDLNSNCDQLLGNINHDGDAEDNVDWKMSSYFAYESRCTLKSFTLFIRVSIVQWIMIFEISARDVI